MFSRRLRPEGVQGASGKPPACMTIDNLAVRNSPWWGPDAPTPARGQGLQPYGALYCFGRRTEGDWGRAESPQCARRRNPLPPVGPDAPTPARIGTCRPMGRSHFSFGGERKVCKRKPAARRLREKGFYCPFWRRGSLCRAQHSWPAYAYSRARSELAFFRRQNGRAFFPPLPIAALLPRSWRGASLPLAGWDVFLWLGYFCNAKGQRDFKITLAFAASHEACRRMAVYAIQAAGSRSRPASREACCRAAVASRPSRMSREQPRAQRARCGVQGYYPCWRDSFSNWRV